MISKTKFKTVDGYIASFPKNIRDILENVRKAIKQSAPKAEEVISYNMPALRFNGILLYYAAHTKHIGFYPMASGIESFKKELSLYEGARGSVKFPFDEIIPVKLISRIVKFRVKENLVKAAAKKKKNFQTCPKGHKYSKSSDCPTCPICEREKKPKTDFLSLLAAPARRALELKKITTLHKLSKFNEKEILTQHGIGPSTIPMLRDALEAKGLSFKSDYPGD